MVFPLKMRIGEAKHACMPHMMRARLSGPTFIFMGGTKPIDPLSEIGRECEWGPLEQKNVIYTGCVIIRTSGGENPNLDPMEIKKSWKKHVSRKSM